MSDRIGGIPRAAWVGLPCVNELPTVHMDLISFDSTATAGNATLIDNGFLCALRDEDVVRAAARFGDSVDLLERWPD
jgi:hypothetical protein